MISTTSLQAFSSAAATGPVNRSALANPALANAARANSVLVRPALLARAQPDAVPRQAAGVGQVLPDIRPGLPPPRGSLLNRTV